MIWVPLMMSSKNPDSVVLVFSDFYKYIRYPVGTMSSTAPVVQGPGDCHSSREIRLLSKYIGSDCQFLSCILDCQ